MTGMFACFEAITAFVLLGNKGEQGRSRFARPGFGPDSLDFASVTYLAGSQGSTNGQAMSKKFPS
jgi:hypothetical protein